MHYSETDLTLHQRSISLWYLPLSRSQNRPVQWVFKRAEKSRLLFQSFSHYICFWKNKSLVCLNKPGWQMARRKPQKMHENPIPDSLGKGGVASLHYGLADWLKKTVCGISISWGISGASRSWRRMKTLTDSFLQASIQLGLVCRARGVSATINIFIAMVTSFRMW